MSSRARIVAGDGDQRHGTANGYCNLRCRCDSCRRAWAELSLKMKGQRADRLTAQDARHGLPSTYANYSCRCGLCRAAATGAKRAARSSAQAVAS